jgi:hypothetical protein
MKKERRDFLKLTTVGATGLALARSRLAQAAWPSSGKMEINPDISNMRVVACVDTKMMKSVPSSMTFDTQNAAVDWPRVQANMDAMAVALTQKATADEAWKTIFRSSKPWADTVVAVKVNVGEAMNTARLAVLQKFSNILTGYGVQPKNFIVYDGNTKSPTAPSVFSASFSTTDKSKVLGVVGGATGTSEDLLGGWKDAQLANGTSRRCAAKIADGTVDILINIANNKGHMMFGKVTLCMKNHYGTWEPDTSHTDLNNLIFNMNKADAIIGGTPARQQLCFVDSMFCNKADIRGKPELMPCYFVMGTFAPAVDYLTVKKVREEVSKLTHDSAAVNSYLTSWGYTTSDPQWILVPPAGDTPDAGPSGTGGGNGSGGAGAGGTTGSSSTGTGGKASGGAGAGGTTGAGGAGTGGKVDAGRPRDASASSGGADAGGSSGSGGGAGGGAGGAGGTGGAASGGSSGSGGSGSGGVANSGGSGSGGSGGSGGAVASTTPGSGGSSASGGSAGAAGASSSATGCTCAVGRGRASAGGLGAGLLLGVLAAGQLRRLLLRKELLSQSEHPQDETKPASATPAAEVGILAHTKERP